MKTYIQHYKAKSQELMKTEKLQDYIYFIKFSRLHVISIISYRTSQWVSTLRYAQNVLYYIILAEWQKRESAFEIKIKKSGAMAW